MLESIHHVGEVCVVLSDNNVKAELSYAYLHAVASRIGLICESGGRHSDDAGVDAVLRVTGRLANDSIFTAFAVDVQLKATSKPEIEQNGRISYSLKLKNYNELRSTSTAGPQLLVVLFLPQDPDEWLMHSEEMLVAQKCAYWLSLYEAPESINKTEQTVYIPRTNLLSVTGLKDLMTRYSRRERLPYDA